MWIFSRLVRTFRKKVSRISIKENVDFNNRNEWYNQFDWIIDKLLKMKKHLSRTFKK